MDLRKKRRVGIDPGTQALKLVQVRAKKNGQRIVEKMGCLPWKKRPGATKGPSESLKSFLKTCSISKGPVSSAIDGPSLLIRRMSMPHMPDKDLAEALKWKVKKDLGEAPENVVMDYLPLGDAPEEGGKTMDLLAFAIKRQALEEHLSLLEDAGLKPSTVEPSATGLLPLFQTSEHLASRKGFVALDLGASHTEFMLIQRGNFVFIRDIPFSGQQLTRSIQEALDVEEDRAEEWKKAVGLLDNRQEKRERESVPGVLWPLVEELFTEIRYSLGYIQDQLEEAASVDTIYLFGGGANLPGLAPALEKDLGLLCETLPEFPALGFPLAEDFKSYGPAVPSSSLATALGLAIGGVHR